MNQTSKQIEIVEVKSNLAELQKENDQLVAEICAKLDNILDMVRDITDILTGEK